MAHTTTPPTPISPNWPKVITEGAQKALTLRNVLPGHGGSGGKELLEGQKQFMLELHNAVQAAVKQAQET